MSQGCKVGGDASTQVTQVGASRALSRTERAWAARGFHSCSTWNHAERPSRAVFRPENIELRLVQVYMSKQPGMDAQKVLQHQYSTAETLDMTNIRDANDVLKLTTP